MGVADLQIKTKVRAVLSRHWIDLTRIGFDCCRGSVRFRGEIVLSEGHRCSSPGPLIDALEAEIKRIRGVKSVYLMGVTVAASSRAPSQESSGESDGIEATVSDLEIKSRVRGALTKHRLDLTALDFDCCKGSVSFRGRICFAEGHTPPESNVPLLEMLQMELKRIPGVRKVYFLGVKVPKSEPQE